jgi:Tfp pilus assembly protein PilP
MAITGTLLDGKGLMVVFAKEKQDFVVRAGDMLDENYRVETIDTQSVTVRYLPLKITQVLPMGAPQ